jgi:hypothetical protein
MTSRLLLVGQAARGTGGADEMLDAIVERRSMMQDMARPRISSKGIAPIVG